MRTTRSVSVAGWKALAPIPLDSSSLPQGRTACPNPSFSASLSRWMRMRHRPDRARKADFAEIDAIGGKGKTGEGRNQCRRDRQIGGRLGDAVAAGDVEIDVVLCRSARRNAPRAPRAPSTAARASQPTTARRGVPSDEGATSAWISTSTGRVPSMPANTAAPGALALRSPRNSSDGLATSRRPLVRHFEHADLVGRPEAVLHRAQDAEVMAAFALEIEHGVDHVLDDARAGDLALLGDMADQHDRRAGRLGVADHRLRRRRAPG